MIKQFFTQNPQTREKQNQFVHIKLIELKAPGHLFQQILLQSDYVQQR